MSYRLIGQSTAQTAPGQGRSGQRRIRNFVPVERLQRGLVLRHRLLPMSLLLAFFALVGIAAGCGSDDSTSSTADSTTASASRSTTARRTRSRPSRRHADDRHRQARLPALLRGQRPDQRRGLRERRRLRDRRPARLHRGPGRVDDGARSTPPSPRARRTSTSTSTRSRSRRSAPRPVDFSAPYYEADQAIVVATDSDLAGATSLADFKDANIGVQIGTTSLEAVNAVDPAEQRPAGLPDLQRRRPGAQERPGRRRRRRRPDRLLPDRGAGAGRPDRRPVPGPRRRPVGRGAGARTRR